MKNTCFAAHKDGCKILDVECCSTKCSFRKTKARYELDALAALAHLATLPSRKQRAISEKYFDGSMPWLDVVEVKKHAR